MPGIVVAGVVVWWLGWAGLGWAGRPQVHYHDASLGVTTPDP